MSITKLFFSSFSNIVLQCSHACGRKGRQQRHLYCYHRSGKKVTRNNCVRAPRPLRKRKCNQYRCKLWFVGWVQCISQ